MHASFNDLNDKNCYSALLNFWVIALCWYSYFIFVLAISHRTIKAMDMKLHRMIVLIEKNKNRYSLIHDSRVILSILM
jgi:hypothetical protein